MDSINQSQTEENREDLVGEAAIQKIAEMVKSSQTCFFCTKSANGTSAGARPMNVRQVDPSGNLWFLSASDSRKNCQLAQNAAVELFFQGSEHSDFLRIQGTAVVSTDRQRIKELWEPIIRTWFTGGVDDPRITVIQVIPSEGYYWDNKHGSAVAAVKMLIGAALRKTLDDSLRGPFASDGRRTLLSCEGDKSSGRRAFLVKAPSSPRSCPSQNAIALTSRPLRPESSAL